MTAYDVVQVVRPGTVCSTEPGRWLATTCVREDDATRTADAYNRHVAVSGISYSVESHHDESADRAIAYRDRPRA